MRFVYKTDGTATLDNLELPHAELICVDMIRHGNPTGITIHLEVDELVISHSALLDRQLDACEVK